MDTVKEKIPLSTVEVVIGMQRDLDAYDFAFTNLIGYLHGKFGRTYKPAIIKGMAMSEDVNARIDALCTAAFELRSAYDKIIEKYGEEECC